ncbi:MAG: ERF family protein [Patescibacteria group bacterium]|nr:ERF family protein [Patescibacteria group bacterium]
MQQSAQIDQLATALAKAQAEITGAKKNSDNPFFKSKYADLAEVWDVIREPLSRNGLAVLQFPSFRISAFPGADGTPIDPYARVYVTTILTHASGQFVADELSLKPSKDDPQSVGSAITYARRYALAAAVGVAQEDDDGERATRPEAPAKPTDNSASTTTRPKERAKPEPKKQGPSLAGQCKELADKLGLPQAARKAMSDDAKGDLSKVLAKLREVENQKAQDALKEKFGAEKQETVPE